MVCILERLLWNFLLNLGMKEENLRFRDHGAEELSFYSNATSDIEYLIPIWMGRTLGNCR